MCTIDDFKILNLSESKMRCLEKELKDWHKQYLPVKETVLDIGAGEGETALLYAAHGARRVIAIEANDNAYKKLVVNAAAIKKKYGTSVEPIHAFLNNIKCDIEGGEEGMVMERHFPGYWKTVGRGHGFPAPIKVVKLVKLTKLEKALRAKELLVLKLTQSDETYKKELAKGRGAAPLSDYDA